MIGKVKVVNRTRYCKRRVVQIQGMFSKQDYVIIKKIIKG